mmetsp:Transcript_65982/g.105884  ORF Transcript_65982/g.105884 Transcript_65982/m.105884 type:complete len:109 (-) Transcript_65982:373-699(-)
MKRRCNPAEVVAVNACQMVSTQASTETPEDGGLVCVSAAPKCCRQFERNLVCTVVGHTKKICSGAWASFSSSAKVSTNPFSANLDAQYIERLGRPKYPLMDDIKTTFG